MADSTRPAAPRLGQQPATIDFIDNRLPQYHPAFVSPPVYYDTVSGQYFPSSQSLAPRPGNDTLVSQSNSAALPVVDEDGIDNSDTANELPARPDWADLKAMEFWTAIFTEAMIRFRATNEPKGRSKTAFNIRDKNDWDAVYDILEAARGSYLREGGKLGWLRKVRRKAADHISPAVETAKMANKICPDDIFATPVLGSVEVLFEAVQTAAKVRNEVLEGFDGLIPIFSDVELFLGTFPKDVKIRNASVELTVTTLDAIERAIGFFLSNELLRAGKAFFTRGDYEKDLRQSLSAIKEKSRSLMEEASKSHIYEFHMYSRETQKLHNLLFKSQQNIADGINSINHLLADHLKQKDRELEAARQELLYLRVENGLLQTTSMFQYSVWPPPSSPPSPLLTPQIQTPIMEWFINQDTLRRMLDSPDLDLIDTAFIADKKEEIPAKQRVQAEQIVNTQLFRDWIVSASSAKLLVQWDIRPPRTIAGVSPLSVFCTAMAQALRANPRFVSALWFCGRHIDVNDADSAVGPHMGGRAMLLSLIDQLLRQNSFDTRSLHREVDFAGLQAGHMSDLTRLLGWLVRRLPETTTFFCIIDGIVLYEREEFEAEALEVFSALLRLAGDRSVPASVKVLFTSTPGTDVVRGVFEGEDLILNVDGLPRLGWAPNEERMTRELEGANDLYTY